MKRRPSDEASLERSFAPLDPSELTVRERAARLDALARADDYGAIITWHRAHPDAAVSTDQVLTMLEQNYLVRVAEMWRIYQASDLAGQGSQEGSSAARNNALSALRLLSDEDSKLTNMLKDFGRIVPKSLQLHGKTKDTLEALRAMKREMETDQAASGPSRPPHALAVVPDHPSDESETP